VVIVDEVIEAARSIIIFSIITESMTSV